MTLAGTIWAPIGPSPIINGAREDNGIVTAIAVNPNNSSIIYIGTAGGGVWRTSDGGVTWKPIFDHQRSLAIGAPGALAIDPSNTDTLYAGTSGRILYRSFNPNTGTFDEVQAGLFKSTDGGASWVRLGFGFPSGTTSNADQFFERAIHVVIVDPADSNTVYLACNTGVYRSVDGGQNWTLGMNANRDTESLVLDTSSPAASRILYAGISGQGVFRSSDGGQNWAQILSNATPVVASALCLTPPCTPTRGLGRISVALAPPVSPPNPSGVQVLLSYHGRHASCYRSISPATNAPDPVGIFIRTNQYTWTQRCLRRQRPTFRR